MTAEQIRLLLNAVSEGPGMATAMDGLRLWLDQNTAETAAQVLTLCERRLAKTAALASEAAEVTP